MKLFLFVILFALFIFPNQISAQNELPATAAWQVQKYEISATLPASPTDRNLTAKATVTALNVGRAAGGTLTFRINQKAEVISAKVGAAEAGFRKTIDDKLGNLQRFTVTLPGSVQPNESTTVTVDYRLPVTENNGVAAISLIGSQFLPLSSWYPTPNNPLGPRGADFASFRLSLTAPSGETVVSSGKSAGSSFEQNLNAQPFFITGVWDSLDAGGITVLLPKGANAEERARGQELAALANDAKNYMTNLLGSAPDVPIRLVAVRRGAGFADGGTILLDQAVFRRPKTDAVTAMSIAESIAKMWLGNATAVRGEGYGAIREGLAAFAAAEFIEKQFGADAAASERLRQRTAFALISKRDVPLSQSSPVVETYFSSNSNKGAMIWRLLAQTVGADKFWSAVKQQLQGSRGAALTLAGLRESLTSLPDGEKIKQILDYEFDQTTDADLMVGLPQARGNETAVAVRNTGSLPVAVNVVATTEKGERLTTALNIPEKNFGEAVFKTTAKILRVEIDPEKLYPQVDFSNDIAPREFTENDLLADITRNFTKPDFPKAEAAARKVLQLYPHFDEARTWLGRALLEQNRLDEAERELNTALNEKLPTPKTLAWTNIGLGEIAMKRNQPAQAAKFFNIAVRADAEYGANLAARNARIKAETAANALPTIDEAAKSFFAQFDKAALTARKAEVESYVLNGELTRFSGGITGNQPEQWQTQVLRTEILDANRIAVDVSLNLKVINQDAKSGTALFIIARTPTGWKLSGVDLFEVR